MCVDTPEGGGRDGVKVVKVVIVQFASSLVFESSNCRYSMEGATRP